MNNVKNFHHQHIYLLPHIKKILTTSLMTWQKYLVKIDIYLHYPVLFFFVTLPKRYFYSSPLDLHIQINLKGKIKNYLKLSYNWLSWNKINSFSSYMEGFTGVYSLEHQNTGIYSLEHWNTVLYSPCHGYSKGG